MKQTKQKLFISSKMLSPYKILRYLLFSKSTVLFSHYNFENFWMLAFST